MKPLFLSLLIVFSFGTVHAQEKALEKNAVTQEKNHSFNLRFSPIGVLLGMVAVRGDYLITDHFALGAGLLYWNWNFLDNNLKVTGFSGVATYYFNPRFRHSWYVNGGVSTASIDATLTQTGGTKRTANLSGLTGASVGGGYHWFWSSFNLNVGLSLGVSSANKVEYKDASGTVVETTNISSLNGGPEFLLGWTF